MDRSGGWQAGRDIFFIFILSPCPTRANKKVENGTRVHRYRYHQILIKNTPSECPPGQRQESGMSWLKKPQKYPNMVIRNPTIFTDFALIVNQKVRRTR